MARSRYGPEALATLRDFQRDTADYVFARMFGDGDDATSRFLVADEVGLGKTLVARGVIAKAIDHLRDTGDRRIDIVYIASNSAIATTNVRKLAPAGVETDRSSDRLSMLPFRVAEMGRRPINVIALTPATSIDLKSSGGSFPERAAVFAALRSIWSGHRLRGVGVARVFAGGIQETASGTPVERLRARADGFGRLTGEVRRTFERAIARLDRERKADKRLGVDAEIHLLAAHYARNTRPSLAVAQRRSVLIRELREAMAWTGVQMLKPDLVIMDEFQRFRALLREDSDDEISTIARALFNHRHERFNRTTRVLLLSATPYIMHTTPAEVASGSDSHLQDFLATYRFLAVGQVGVDADGAVAALSAALSQAREAILRADRAGTADVRAAFETVRGILTRVMVRTERLASTPDHDGMLTEVPDRIGSPTAAAFRQYVDTASTAAHVRRAGHSSSADMVEYWKSAPYTLSYLGGHGYQIRAGLPIRASGKGSARASSAEVRLSLRGSSALIPWEDIRLYRELDPANGRLQGLWEDLLDAGAHRLLWLPPAAPYYRYPEGRFDDDTARALTKRLVFSAWALVPTAISTLTSYEVERRLRDEEAATRTRRSDTETFYDTESNARHVRHLRMDGSGPSMTVLPLVLPSPALAALCDPLSLSAELGSAHGLPTWSMVKSQAVARIREALALILPEAPRRKNGSAAWYSLAPMLLDSLSASSAAYDPELTVAPRTDDVAQQGQLQGALVDLQDMLAKALDSMFREDDGGLTARVSDRSLPAVPTNLEEVLAEIALASPSYAILRALRRSFPDLDVSGLVDATMVASMGMLSLLNSWEGTHIVRASGRRKYWRQALAYCAEGHLQAVMDEYVAALFEWQGRDREADGAKALMATARDLAAAMTLRTTVYDVLRPDGGQLTPQPMRGRFAVRFGDARSEDAGDMRSQAVSLSFNSPFWPFVLATTSVGQEGLDFHLYCHAVSHWNLPSNPVDLEQREGRVHRYKGHAIRKNVATAFGPPSGAGEPWSELFQRALDATEEGRESEIVPFWVFTPEGEGVPAARIERHLPIMPLSREASRRDPLLASVAYYRLAFGQPRQTDLVDFVLNRIEDDQVREELRDLRVDLSPPRRGA